MDLKALVYHHQRTTIIQWSKRHQLPTYNAHKFYRWGCFPKESVRLPKGPFVMLTALLAGYYDAYFPKRIMISVRGFYLAEHIGGSWYHLNPKQYIEGVILAEGGVERVYWLMLVPNPQFALSKVWPKIHFMMPSFKI
ncbi:MAG: hypothetical protein ACON5A_05215 [Candidatus Comchoanobacterales bacterium]